MIKKNIPIIIASALILGLTACTSPNVDLAPEDKGASKEASFTAPVKAITTLPYFNLDVEGLGLGVWGEGNNSDPRKSLPTANPSPDSVAGTPEDNIRVDLDPNAPDPVPVDVQSTEHPDTILFFNISLNDTSTKCVIAGQVSYLDTYLNSRGDSFNSFQQLYSLPPASEDPISNAGTTEINGVTYAVGTYTTPEVWGTNKFHKTAVRVLSEPVERIEGNASFQGELGNWNSDSKTGLPVVTIDFSCPTEKDLTDARWEDGVKWYDLTFNKANPYTPVADKSTDIVDD